MHRLSEEQFKKIREWAVPVILLVVVCLVIFFAIFRYTGIVAVVKKIIYILRPLLIGIVIAYLLSPVYDVLYGFLCGKLHIKAIVSKVIGLTLSVAFAIFIIYAFFAVLIPALYTSIRDFIYQIPTYADNIQSWLETFLENNPDVESAVMSEYNSAYSSFEDWLYDNVLPNLNSTSDTVSWLQSNVLPRLSTVVSSLSSAVMGIVLFIKDFIIGLIISVYIIATKDRIAAHSKKLLYAALPVKAADFAIREIRHDNSIFGGFIIGKIIDSAIIAAITFVVLSIMHMPYTAVITFIVGLTNIIPFFGPFIGAIPSAILVCLVDPFQALYFIIFIFILQQFDGNILGPKILGSRVGLPGLWVIIAVLFFGGMFGFGGMILGVPIAAVLYSIARRVVNFTLEKKQCPLELDAYMKKGVIPVSQQEPADKEQPEQTEEQ